MKTLAYIISAWLSIVGFGLSLTPAEKKLNVRPESDAAWTPKEKRIIAQVRTLLEARYKDPVDARYHISYSKSGGMVTVLFVKGYDKETREIQIGGHCVVLLDDKLAPTDVLKGF